MKLKGTKSVLGNTTFFAVVQLGHPKYPDVKIPLCSGRCNVVFKGNDLAYHQAKNNNLTLAWGYDGALPHLLSIGLLSLALLEQEKDYQVSDFNQIDSRHLGPWRTTVLRNYRKFTRQVTAKLPDQWEITTEEVRQWIKNKTLPAVIRNINNKNQRTYGKEKETNRKETSAGRKQPVQST